MPACWHRALHLLAVCAGMRRATEPGELEQLEADFGHMQEVQEGSVETIENTWIANAGDNTSRAPAQYVVHDLTMGSDRCKDIRELRKTLRPRKLLSSGGSGSIVVLADEDKVIFKNVVMTEFANFVPLLIQREAMRTVANESALYHTSMLSPICWGLSEIPSQDVVWIVMPNVAVPTGAALEAACAQAGRPPLKRIFDVKSKSNNGPVRSSLWQAHFGRRADWEYGLETSFPGGFTFDSTEDAQFVFQSLQSDVKALTAQDLCDYSLMIVVYGCEGSQDPIAKLTSNAYDFSVRTKGGDSVRISLALIDFGLKYDDIPRIVKWVGGKGWSSEDYGAKFMNYVEETLRFAN